MKRNFITGLVLLLPIAVTIAVISFVVNFLTQPFLGVVSDALSHFDFMKKGILFLSPDQIVNYTAKLLILMALFVLTILLGMFTRWFFLKSVIELGDHILHKIPIVKTVYKTSQDIIKTIFVSDKNSFKQVVMVPFPRPGVFVLGLIVRESPKKCSTAVGKDLISVLVPTTPNPTTGFLLMMQKEEMIMVDIKPEDAIKYIVSCGVIVPSDDQRPPLENL